MPMEKTISVIDLGTTKIVCLAGTRTPDGYKVIAACEAPSQGIMRGEVINNQSVLNSLRPLLSELEEERANPRMTSWLELQASTSGVRRPAVQSTEVIKWRITQDEVDNMRRNMFNSRVDPGEEVLHVVPQSYHVDEYRSIPNPAGMCGGCIEANYRLFIGKSVSAQHTRRCIESAGLRLSKLVLEPMASASAVLQDDEKELGVAMVDIGGGTTDLLIYHDNIIRHTAVIPFGGNVITEDIRQGCEVTLRQAEQMKIQYGSCYVDLAPENKSIVISGIGGREPREIPFRFLANIIEARMEEILEAVVYEIRQSGYAEKLPAGIVLTGGGALLTHLPQFIKYKTGYDARIARPRGIEFDDCDEVNSVTYSCAVGLLMQGFEPVCGPVTEQQMDLEAIFAGVETKIPAKQNKTEKAPKVKKKRRKVPEALVTFLPYRKVFYRTR
jgi:cell division protein FtsA